MCRDGSVCKVGWISNHDEADVAGHRHGDHVPVDHLTRPDPCVMALGNNVQRNIAHEQVE
jgi:hypothetical protein